MQDEELKAELDKIQYPPILWNGHYEKVMYWVHLYGGAKVKCWPNAGIMNSTDGSGRSWTPEDNIMVSVCSDDPHLRGGDYKDRCELANHMLQLKDGEDLEPVIVDAELGTAVRDAVIRAATQRRLVTDTPALVLAMGTNVDPGLGPDSSYPMLLDHDQSAAEMQIKRAFDLETLHPLDRQPRVPEWVQRIFPKSRWSESKRLKHERYLAKKKKGRCA